MPAVWAWNSPLASKKSSRQIRVHALKKKSPQPFGHALPSNTRKQCHWFFEHSQMRENQTNQIKNNHPTNIFLSIIETPQE
jgi:hypothetical protein